MPNNVDWDLAVASAQSARYVYLDWDTCNYNIQVNVTKSFQTHIQIFDKGGAQAIGFNSAEHNAYFISFRGTQEWSDIVADVNALYYDTKHGSVHTGFINELNKISKEILQWVVDNNKKQSQIIVTGHSLGAGMATLFYARLLDNNFSNVSLYTFGSPKVGTQHWTENINKCDLDIHRFVNNNDIIPHTPPTRLYHHLSGSHYIMYSGDITSKLTPWEKFRDKLLSRFKAISKFQFFDGIYDHSMPRYLKKIEHYARSKK